ncbi:hypothetical protein VPHD69_0311 [Vibrio phage D69]
MANPSEADIRALFNPTPNRELALEWIDARLEEKAELQVPDRYEYSFVDNVEIDVGAGEALGEIIERSHCSCCGDDYHGTVEITEEELIQLLKDPNLLKRQIEEQKAIRKREEEERAADRRRKQEASEKVQYDRLKRKFG